MKTFATENWPLKTEETRHSENLVLLKLTSDFFFFFFFTSGPGRGGLSPGKLD